MYNLRRATIWQDFCYSQGVIRGTTIYRRLCEGQSLWAATHLADVILVTAAHDAVRGVLAAKVLLLEEPLTC